MGEHAQRRERGACVLRHRRRLDGGQAGQLSVDPVLVLRAIFHDRACEATPRALSVVVLWDFISQPPYTIIICEMKSHTDMLTRTKNSTTSDFR